MLIRDRGSVSESRVADFRGSGQFFSLLYSLPQHLVAGRFFLLLCTPRLSTLQSFYTAITLLCSCITSSTLSLPLRISPVKQPVPPQP